MEQARRPIQITGCADFGEPTVKDHEKRELVNKWRDSMIPMILREAIRDASTQLGSDACRAGKHQWESIGGRACPYDRSGSCSQAVYSCSVCEVYDYGQRGGPGHADCENLCKEKP